jgi:glycosyltransferase involved in cell wall biosynthesis
MTGHHKPVILVFNGFYLPGFKAGGPIRTLANMAEGLAEDFSFRIVTRDRDAGDVHPYPGIHVNQWNTLGGSHVFYADPRGASFRGIVQLLRETNPDVVYLNSFFDPTFTVRPLVARFAGFVDSRTPWVIAPRGEFARAALAVKPFKKTAFLAIAKAARLYKGLVWQASSEHERQDIEREFGIPLDQIRVAPDMTSPIAATAPSRHERQRGDACLRLCFLSRISPMKNLDFAIEVLRGAQRPITFDIYGPIDDHAYAAACREAAASLPSNVRVAWKGEVGHQHVGTTFAGYDAFFFPSRGENFGHVVFESLAAATPVLVSDRTPWRDLDARNAGWVRPLEKEAFLAVIEALAAMPEQERLAMSQAAWKYSCEIARSSDVRIRNKALFADLLPRSQGNPTL